MTEEKKNPQRYVLEDVCIARTQALETKMKYLFGTSIITIVLIIVQIVCMGR